MGLRVGKAVSTGAAPRSQDCLGSRSARCALRSAGTREPRGGGIRPGPARLRAPALALRLGAGSHHTELSRRLEQPAVDATVNREGAIVPAVVEDLAVRAEARAGAGVRRSRPRNCHRSTTLGRHRPTSVTVCRPLSASPTNSRALGRNRHGSRRSFGRPRHRNRHRSGTLPSHPRTSVTGLPRSVLNASAFPPALQVGPKVEPSPRRVGSSARCTS
jgi:hypothetical protein